MGEEAGCERADRVRIVELTAVLGDGLGCRLAREAVSAIADGEVPPISRAATEAHLAGCQGCRDFQAKISLLNRRLSVCLLPAIPDRTEEILARLGADRVQSAHTNKGRYRKDQLCHSLRRASRWAVTAVPLGLAVPALVLGTSSHLHIVASHVVAPCAMFLAHHLRG
jgi:predicted anti-sigma-YlaC factor YlaD